MKKNNNTDRNLCNRQKECLQLLTATTMITYFKEKLRNIKLPRSEQNRFSVHLLKSKSILKAVSENKGG